MIYRLVKKADILPLAAALIAHLRSKFNHVLALLFFMPAHFKSTNYYQNRPEIKLFLQKNFKKLQNLRALSDPPPPDHRDSSPISNF